VRSAYYVLGLTNGRPEGDAGDLAYVHGKFVATIQAERVVANNLSGIWLLKSGTQPGDLSHPLMWETVSVWRTFRTSLLPACRAAATLARAGAEPPCQKGFQNCRFALREHVARSFENRC
jgi:hypothetical protein